MSIFLQIFIAKLLQCRPTNKVLSLSFFDTNYEPSGGSQSPGSSSQENQTVTVG